MKKQKMVSLRLVSKVIPFNDTYDLIHIEGWQCLAPKAYNLEENQVVFYFSNNAILPPTEAFNDLKEQKYRVLPCCHENIISNGYIVPLEIYPGLRDKVFLHKQIQAYDLQNLYEEKLKDQLRIKWCHNWAPHFVAIQDRLNLFEKHRLKQTKFKVTEKIKGYTYQALLKRKQFSLYSKHYAIKSCNALTEGYYDVTHKYRIEECLKAIQSRYNAHKVLLQGEMIGPDIQQNPYHVIQYELYVFAIYVDNRRLSEREMQDIFQTSFLKSVPVLKDVILDDFDDLINMAQRYSNLWKRECYGLVFEEINGSSSFKVLNPYYYITNYR